MSIQNVSHDDIDDVIAMVNKNAKRADEEIKTDAYFAAVERAVAASIKSGGVKDVKAENKRFIEERAQIIRKKTILKLIALITAAVLTIGGTVYAGSRIIEQSEIHKATLVEIEKAEKDLQYVIAKAKGGSFVFSSDDSIGQMATFLTTDEYSELDVNDIGRVYAYKLILSESEFEEFIRSLHYVENGQVYNYVSFRQYLNINGYPGENEFVNKAQTILLETYRNDNQNTKGGRQ